MIRFGQNPAGELYFGPQDATAGTRVDVESLDHAHSVSAATAIVVADDPVILGVTPSTPTEAQTGVLVQVANDGGEQGTFAYNGIVVTVTGYAPGNPATYTVTWPTLAVDGSATTFNQSYGLVFSPQAGAPSAPFGVTTLPDPDYQYVLIGTRDPGLPVDEGLFYDDTLGTGDTYVYGIGLPDTDPDDWDYTGLANHYINAAPNGGTFAYRLWDVALGQWSGEATENFTVETAALPATPEPLTHAHAVSEPVLNALLDAEPESLAHEHELDNVVALRVVAAEPEGLTHLQPVSEPTLVETGTEAVAPVLQLHALGEPTTNKQTAAQPEDLTNPHRVTNVQGPSASRIEEAFIEQYNDRDGRYFPPHRKRRRR